MAKYMISFGHGYSKSGAYDTGCTHKGFTEQEMVRRLKEPLKKYAKQAGIILHFYDNDMYADRNITSYKGYILTEVHLDAPAGNGGHVIIHNAFEPDAIDKRLAKMIQKHFESVGYVGADGINGRDDLYNCNVAKNHNINYRLLELFFLSNDNDRNYYVKHIDSVAKDMIEALTGKAIPVAKPAKPAKPTPTKPNKATTHKVVKGDSLWAIGEKYGVTVANLKAWNNLKSDVIQPNQVLKLTAPPKSNGIGLVTVKVPNLWYYNQPSWGALYRVVTKGEVFTVMQELTVDGAKMLKLKSGNYITANPKFVTYKRN